MQLSAEDIKTLMEGVDTYTQTIEMVRQNLLGRGWEKPAAEAAAIRMIDVMVTQMRPPKRRLFKQ